MVHPWASSVQRRDRFPSKVTTSWGGFLLLCGPRVTERVPVPPTSQQRGTCLLQAVTSVNLARPPPPDPPRTFAGTVSALHGGPSCQRPATSPRADRRPSPARPVQHRCVPGLGPRCPSTPATQPQPPPACPLWRTTGGSVHSRSRSPGPSANSKHLLNAVGVAGPRNHAVSKADRTAPWGARRTSSYRHASRGARPGDGTAWGRGLHAGSQDKGTAKKRPPGDGPVGQVGWGWLPPCRGKQGGSRGLLGGTSQPCCPSLSTCLLSPRAPPPGSPPGPPGSSLHNIAPAFLSPIGP